jgi:glutamate carboxypeptidase
MLDDYLPHFQSLQQNMTWRLSTLVEMETPTSEKLAVDAVMGDLAEWAEDCGAEVTVHAQSMVGNFVECRWNYGAPGKPILMCCHVDTVHPLGTVDKRPTRIEGDVLYGAGSFDMKAGIVVVQTVIEELQNLGKFPARPLTVLFTSDEEIGSPYSRRFIEQRSREAGLVLVYEFCNYAEDVVTGRKGVGIFHVTALGREAHSGGAAHQGINAVVELAHHIEDILAIADPDKGTQVHPTVIKGGTRHNVIPGDCTVTVNVRVQYRSEAERVDEAMTNLVEQPTYLKGAELVLTGDFMRPPMEQDAKQAQTFKTLQDITGAFLGEEARGEASDANFAAATGTPTLCGMGPAGEGAHAEHEQVYLPSMPRRAALLASILCDWPPM